MGHTLLQRLGAHSPVLSALTDHIETWEYAVRDDNGWWSASNPTRLTVPAGVTHARFGIQHPFTNNANAAFTRIKLLKNGHELVPPVTSQRDRIVGFGYTNNDHCCISYTMPVTPGDYFEVELRATTAFGDIAIARGPYFWVEDFGPGDWRGIVLGHNDSPAETYGTNLQNQNDVNWTDVIHEADSGISAGMWSVSDPGKIYMPEGYSHARCRMCIAPNPAAASDAIGVRYRIQRYRSGADSTFMWNGLGQAGANSGIVAKTLPSRTFDIQPGDYLVGSIWFGESTADTNTLDIDGPCWFEVQLFRPTSP